MHHWRPLSGFDAKDMTEDFICDVTLVLFVFAGENLEMACRREVEEEVGVKVGKVEFIASQPWPLPNTLMIGFSAQAQESTDLQVSDFPFNNYTSWKISSPSFSLLCVALLPSFSMRLRRRRLSALVATSHSLQSVSTTSSDAATVTV